MLFTWEFGRNPSSQNDTVASARRHNRAFLTPRLLNSLFNEVNPAEAEEKSVVRDLILWTLLVCGSTTPIAEDRIYYADLVRMYFPDAWTWKYEEVQHLGRVLPWIDPPEDPPAEAFWELVTRAEGGLAKAWRQDSNAPFLNGFGSIIPGWKIRAKSEETWEKQDEEEEELCG
jgi:hypothetical protein